MSTNFSEVKLKDTNTLYIAVPKWLIAKSKEQVVVQVAHAAAIHPIKHSGTIVILQVDNLESCVRVCENNSISYSVFVEPDMGSVDTAICMGPVLKSSSPFKRLKLLRF